MVSAMDIMPTVAEIAGAAPGPFPFDGKSLTGVINGDPSPHDAFFFYQGYQLHAVRSGQWKYMYPPLPQHSWCSTFHTDIPGRLSTGLHWAISV